MNSSLFVQLGRRSAFSLLAALALAIAGGAGLAIAQSKSEAKASVSVKVDNAPLNRNAENAVSFSPIVKRVAPSVVRVETKEFSQSSGPGYVMSPFGPIYITPNGNGMRMQQQPVEQGVGSGVIVSADGYILTNNHVVSGADKLKVIMTDGRELPATVVGTDERTDIAVIKVNAKDLPAITFAESSAVEIGDRVLAIGNPFGLDQTVTTGIVSAKDRQIGILNQADQRNGNMAKAGYEDFIQTDAAINRGNSGGALVDVQGRLVGINSAIVSDGGGSNGAGFAIPADLARSVMNSLVRDGKVVRGYLGVTPTDVSPTLAEQLKLKDTRGSLIADVTEGDPAADAGFKAYDVVVRYDGRPVTDTQKLRLMIAETAPGATVKIDVLRDGKEQTLTAKVGDLDEKLASNSPRIRSNRNRTNPSPAAPATPDSRLDGVSVMDLTSRLRSEFGIPGTIRSGAVVTEVDPASAAADAGLAVGDVILEIDRKPVKNAEDAMNLTKEYGNGKTLLRFYNSRGSSTNVLSVDEANNQPAQVKAARGLFGR